MKIKCIVFLLLFYQSAVAFRISIEAPSFFIKNSITEQTLNDFSSLLTKAGNQFFFEQRNPLSTIVILLDPSKVNDTSTNESFEWSFIKKEKKVFILRSFSYIGFSNGLYAFLQEKLGFQFFHPKELFIPEKLFWPLDTGIILTGSPVFKRRGFHIHTQHPLELTSYLLDYTMGENGISEVKHYIDWLARNQQNYFQFKLLESVDIEK